MSSTPRLLDVPMAGLYPIALADANRFLVDVGHALGPVDRPFRSEAFGWEVDGQLVAVAVSASIVSAHVVRQQTGERFARGEVVELARLAAANPWANRVMCRLWREVCAPRWECWPVSAAVSYSLNSRHDGSMYRFDGWEKWGDNAGSSGGGAWTRKRHATDAVHGPKTLWGWRYPEAA